MRPSNVLQFTSIVALVLMGRSVIANEPIPDRVQGRYVEARTCQIYTGPCFANGEVGSAGKHAMLSWQFSAGVVNGVDLSNQCVALILKSDRTLGFHGIDDAQKKRAVIVVPAKSSALARSALIHFVLTHTGLDEEEVAHVQESEIRFDFDMAELTAQVEVQDVALLKTRKARKGDCICSNESAYYPPLLQLEGFVPGVTIEGEVTARKLGTRWSIPDSRSAYMGTFDLSTQSIRLASSK